MWHTNTTTRTPPRPVLFARYQEQRKPSARHAPSTQRGTQHTAAPPICICVALHVYYCTVLCTKTWATPQLRLSSRTTMLGVPEEKDKRKNSTQHIILYTKRQQTTAAQIYIATDRDCRLHTRTQNHTHDTTRTRHHPHIIIFRTHMCYMLHVTCCVMCWCWG